MIMDAAKKNVVITLNKAFSKDTNAVAKRLELGGLRTDKVFGFGVITGSIDPEKVAEMRHLKEIESIDDDMEQFAIQSKSNPI